MYQNGTQEKEKKYDGGIALKSGKNKLETINIEAELIAVLESYAERQAGEQAEPMSNNKIL